jgi:hypothetical protein
MPSPRLELRTLDGYSTHIKFIFFIHFIAPLYSVIKKDGLNLLRLYFLNYKWYVNALHNI